MDRTDLPRQAWFPKTAKLHGLLFRLGITSNYTGFRQCAYAVSLSMERPEMLALVSKCLYPEIAKHYNTTWTAVERNIRSVACIAWERNPKLLREIAGCPLKTRPKSAQFVSILALHLLNEAQTADEAGLSENLSFYG